jgi:hypothetical protein
MILAASREAVRQSEGEQERRRAPESIQLRQNPCPGRLQPDSNYQNYGQRYFAITPKLEIPGVKARHEGNGKAPREGWAGKKRIPI